MQREIFNRFDCNSVCAYLVRKEKKKESDYVQLFRQEKREKLEIK